MRDAVSPACAACVFLHTDGRCGAFGLDAEQAREHPMLCGPTAIDFTPKPTRLGRALESWALIAAVIVFAMAIAYGRSKGVL